MIIYLCILATIYIIFVIFNEILHLKNTNMNTQHLLYRRKEYQSNFVNNAKHLELREKEYQLSLIQNENYDEKIDSFISEHQKHYEMLSDKILHVHQRLKLLEENLK